MADDKKKTRHWWRWPLVVFGVIVLLLVALQLAATPLARAYTHKALRDMQGFEAKVGDVRASVFPPRYSLSDLVLVEKPGGSWREPLLEVRHLEVGISWRKLLRRVLVADVSVERPRMNVVQHKREKNGETNGELKEKAKRVPNLEQELEKEAPLKVAHLDVHHGEVVVIDASRQPPPRLTLKDLDVSIDNLATRAALAEHRPTTLVGTGTLQDSGLVRARIAADPWEKGLNFHGQVSLRDLHVTDVNNLLQSTTDVRPSKGTVDMFAEFRARNGHIDGGVKPVLHDVEVAPADKSLWTHLKSWLADVALDLFSKHQDGEKKVATIIPIKGTVNDPNAQLWPTVLGIVRNAFVEGITEGFKNVPPPTSNKKQGPVEQAAKALTKKHGPPNAEPSGKKDDNARQGRRKH